ncbi:hypothetical protein F5888DRAFT_485071 [Russula emetica]|nr:hypothetical protein F5888DRAFT_485071 [Russula emetica]
MQPYTLTHSLPPAHNHYLHSSAHKADTTRRVKRRKQGDVDPDVTEEEPDNTAMASSSTPRARPRGDYYRRRDTEPFVDNSRHRRRAQKKGVAILADARAEHVLLAARRIGRERASILAGSVTAAGRDKDKDPKIDNDQTDAVPRTPRKHQTVGVGNGSSTGVIYLNSPIPATADTASVEQVSSDFSPAQTPLASRKSIRSQATQGRVSHVNSLTPLDSLLTAASTISMIEDKEDEDEDGDHEDDSVEPDPKPVVSSKPSTRQMAAPGFGSPVPTKRRRVASNKPARSLTRAVVASDVKGTSERTPSALDVLADQAAVFSSQDHDGGNDKGKGKGKAKASDTGSPSRRSDETPMVGELARQKPHPRDQAPQLRPQAVPHQPSTSSPTRVATVTTRGHDPTPPLTSETEPPPSPKNAPLLTTPSSSTHPPSADSSQGTMITPPKDDGRVVLSASSPRTDNCADKEKT